MEPVRSLVLKGLIEGLILHALEREPTHGYALLKSLEDSLGERPSKNQIYPLLRELEEEGYIESEAVEDARTKQVYHLTGKGDERLSAYRSLPHPAKNWIASVFGLPHLKGGEEQPAPDDAPPEAEQTPTREEEHRAPAVDVDRDEAWVAEIVRQLPRGPPVRSSFANISIERDPGAGEWVIRVENHEPGAYEGADRCPLTFLYLATQRLLFEVPLEPGGSLER